MTPTLDNNSIVRKNYINQDHDCWHQLTRNLRPCIKQNYLNSYLPLDLRASCQTQYFLSEKPVEDQD